MSLQPPLAFGSFEWRPARRQLLVAGRPAVLGARAIDLLAALIDRRDRVVPKDELLAVVWPGLIVEENNLAVHVSALRKVLGAERIVTVPGRGYRFTAECTPAAEATAAPSPSQIACNLPQASEIIGRDDELAELTALLEAGPIVTVVGPGGIGKTRLALAVAAAQRGHWRDGVWWVDATGVTRAEQLPQAVAQALGISLTAAGEGPLVAALRPLSLLIVLDNCEGVVDAAGTLVQRLLGGAPEVRVLATSQVLLNVPGEQLYRLRQLAVPSADAADVDEGRYGAIGLFVERARGADRSFGFDRSNAAAIVDICCRLDGMPLAIELAAARVRQLGIEPLRERLDDRLRLLTTGRRGAPRRQQTLRAALEWSYDLLDATQQTVLRRLGVFVGGFTLELAQRVACDDGTEGGIDEWVVLDTLGALVDRSFVSVDAGEPVRYRLLETMRAFALERLAVQAETAALRRRHAHAVCDVVLAVEEARFGDAFELSNSQYMQRLGPEVDNIRAALDWAMNEAQDWPLAVALAGATAPVFLQLGLMREHAPRLQALRVHAASAAPRAQLMLLRRLAHDQSGSLQRAERVELDREAVRLARGTGSRRRLLAALHGLGWSLAAAEDFPGAEAIVAEMRSLEQRGDRPLVCLPRLGLQAMILGRRQDDEGAVAVLRAMLELLRAPGEDLGLAVARSNLASNLNSAGRHDEAAAVAREALEKGELPRGFNSVGFELIYALAALGRGEEALAAAREQRRWWHLSALWRNGDSLAMLAAACGRLADAFRFDGAQRRGYAAAEIVADRLTLRMRERLRNHADAAGVSPQDCERWRCEGDELGEAALLELANRLCD